MATPPKRARTTDRDLAVDLLKAALMDGQLDQPEYEARVGRVLQAATLEEIGHDLADLQGVERTQWAGSVPVVPSASSPARPSHTFVVTEGHWRDNRTWAERSTGEKILSVSIGTVFVLFFLIVIFMILGGFSSFPGLGDGATTTYLGE